MADCIEDHEDKYVFIFGVAVLEMLKLTCGPKMAAIPHLGVEQALLAWPGAHGSLDQGTGFLIKNTWLATMDQHNQTPLW